MKRLAVVVLAVAASWFATPNQSNAYSVYWPTRKCDRCRCRPLVDAPNCPIIGEWINAPCTTPNYRTCNPLFNAGAPLEPQPPEVETVVRLTPIVSGPPKEPGPTRPITREIVRPPRILDEVPEDGQPRPRPGDKAGTGKIHVLTLVDANAPNLGITHTAGADALERLLKNGIRADKFGTTVRLTTAELTAEAIGRKLQDTHVDPDDTLVVYYAGSAEFDEAASQFNLTPGRAKFSRDDLRKMALAKSARLTVLLTDPATNPAIAKPAAKPEEPNPGRAGLERLFFGVRGVVDLHACSAGEFAAARGEYGGCFTLAFVREFGRPAGSWADLLEGVKFTTNNMFKSYRLEVLRADDVAPAAKAIFRNQESQIPATLTPVDNLKLIGNGSMAPPAADGIESVSLMPPRPAPEKRPAILHLRVPAAASVLIDGEPTTQTGPERVFETPALNLESIHVFEIRLELPGWVGVYRVSVTPGQTTAVELQVPGK